MRIVVIDDDPDVLSDICFFLRSEGLDYAGYPSIKEAREAIEGCEEPFTVLLDHDLGGEPGYTFCAWLRRTHPFGALLPVIYLTGRESPQGFLSQQLGDPFSHPSAYVTKNQLSADGELLPRLLRQVAAQFEAFREVAEEQAARQALLSFSELTDESE